MSNIVRCSNQSFDALKLFSISQTQQTLQQHHQQQQQQQTSQAQPVVSQTITFTPQKVQQHIKQEPQEKWIISNVRSLKSPIPQPTTVTSVAAAASGTRKKIQICSAKLEFIT